MNKNKRELRALLRARRNSLSLAQRREASRHLRRVASSLLLRHKRVGFYLANDGEMDLLPLLNQALWHKRQCFLPVVPERGRRKLWFSLLTGKQGAWGHNRFGIPEHWSHHWVRAWQLDLLLMPLVGFDPQGNRLGMGGGFYDASLAYLKSRKAWRKPVLAGVAFECQKVDTLPADPWDTPLDMVVTESCLYRFKNR